MKELIKRAKRAKTSSERDEVLLITGSLSVKSFEWSWGRTSRQVRPTNQLESQVVGTGPIEREFNDATTSN
jgi:hypothetical protein